MNALRNFLDNVKPKFQEGGKFAKFRSTFGAFETFLFTPNETNKCGVHVRDAVDLKRTMIVVVLALVPALLFGMYNTGYQHFRMTGELADVTFWQIFFKGFLAVLPIIVVSYVVGLAIEFASAQMRGHEVNEGFLVSGMLIPLVMPADVPLWMVGVATAFAVIFGKEVYGGTGMNFWNPALLARVFLFFAYPTKMSGETAWYYNYSSEVAVDGFSGATPLAQANAGHYTDFCDAFFGLIPGSIGETSAVAILIGAFILLYTGVASWKTMISVFVGGIAMGWLFNQIGSADNAMAQLPWYNHLVYGGFCFGAVFMATDPVTSARTEGGKFIYGFLIGAMAIVIRVLNPGFPEGMMLAILLLNTFAPLIDHFFVQANINRRKKRVTIKA
ncbi:MAG: NADH:ubiquinone reductase (Na(+)-transporting) subunit B [Salinivirgaceae bacterium]|nr:NADH:ubiquinone reductase (Na(+)-transporting) subunit B [Salinivirgaceae bacterium]